MMNMHMGRSFIGHPLEDDCPCPQAECGLVEHYAEGCEDHDPLAMRTIRQMHWANDCPGEAPDVRD